MVSEAVIQVCMFARDDVCVERWFCCVRAFPVSSADRHRDDEGNMATGFNKDGKGRS
jgi:hypothetical protein